MNNPGTVALVAETELHGRLFGYTWEVPGWVFTEQGPYYLRCVQDAMQARLGVPLSEIRWRAWVWSPE